MPNQELDLTNGMEVSFRGDVYQIRSSLSHDIISGEASCLWGGEGR
jgi:hypothetical protein